MQIAIFARKSIKVLLFKPRLFLIKITYICWLMLMLKVLKQAKENYDCEEYNFIFGIFAPLCKSTNMVFAE